MEQIYKEKETIFKKYDILILIYLFMLIYMPPFIPINCVIPLSGIAIIYLLIHFKEIKMLIEIVKKTGMWKYYLLTLFGMTILVIRLLFHSNSNLILPIYTTFLIVVLNAICCLFIFLYMIKKKYGLMDLINMLLIVALAESIISLLAFLIPVIKQFFITLYLHNGYTSDYTWLTWRLFGFSNELLFSMPLVQSVLSLCALYLFFNKSKRYIIFVPFLMFSIIVNSRLGLAVFIFGIFVLIIYQLKKGQKKQNWIFLKDLITILFLLIVECMVIFLVRPETGQWFLSIFTDLIQLFLGRFTGFFEYMFVRNGMSIPKGKDFLLGSGHMIIGSGSDSGFINDLWLGGIFYALTMWGSILMLFYLCFQKKKNLITFLSLILLFTFLIANFKGPFFTENEIYMLTGLLAIFMVYETKKEKRK